VAPKTEQRDGACYDAGPKWQGRSVPRPQCGYATLSTGKLCKPAYQPTKPIAIRQAPLQACMRATS
jgi:hypothetical protein